MKSNTARAPKIDWTKVNATSDAKIARQAEQDQTTTPSDHTWQEMVRVGRITLIPPAKVGT